jgi:glutamate--cysteine ligase catalytic subunit
MPRWPGEDSKNAFEEMTLDEIFNGKCCYFPGLIPLVYAYLEYVNCDNEIFVKVDKYLKFISM